MKVKATIQKSYLKSLALCFLAGSLSMSANAVPIVWEPTFGGVIGAADDGTFGVNFGFNFGFNGGSYAAGTVSTNGFLSLGASNGSGCCDATINGLLNGYPRIAPAWYDLVTTVYLNTSVAGRAVLTWQGNEFSNSAINTFQAQLFSSGDIIFGYDTLMPFADGGHLHNAIVGLSPGGGTANPGEIDFTGALLTNTGSSVYEFFDRRGSNPETFDLAGTNICFSPTANSGWSVSGGRSGCVSSVPEPGSLTLLGLGLAGLGFSRRKNKKA